MPNLDDLQFIISVVTLLGFVFIAYRTFRDPDIKADKAIDLLKQDVANQTKLASAAIETNQNCIHSLENEVSDLKVGMGALKTEIAVLTTIINERIPKKE